MQKQLTRLLILCSIVHGVSFSASAVRAQEAKETPAGEPTAAVPSAIYRVEYVVREIEKGKPANTRSYILMARSDVKGRGEWAKFRVGSRVPIPTTMTKTEGPLASTQFQYQNVGMNIDSRLSGTDKGLIVGTILDLTSVGNPEMSGALPVLRQLRLEDDTLVVPGKPALVGSIDDVTADRRYEIEVTATKIK